MKKPFLYYLTDAFPEHKVDFEQAITDAFGYGKRHGLSSESDLMRYACLALYLTEPGEPADLSDFIINAEKFHALLANDEEAINEFFQLNQFPVSEESRGLIANAIKAANEIKPDEITLANPSTELSVEIYEGKPVNEEWLKLYHPAYHYYSFHPLEIAVKMGNLDAVKKIFNHIIKLNDGYLDILRNSQEMEITGRPIFWLAAICDSGKVPHKRPTHQDYINIIEFLEKELKILPGHEHFRINKYDYIDKYASPTDPLKKQAMLGYCKNQELKKISPGSLKESGLFGDDTDEKKSASKVEDVSASVKTDTTSKTEDEEENKEVQLPTVVKMQNRSKAKS